jgi:hypothetical protein
MWGMGFSAYLSGALTADQGIISRRDAAATQGWIFFYSATSGNMGFYACNGASQAGPAGTLSLTTPIKRNGSIMVFQGIVNVTSNYIQQWADGVKLGQVALGGAYSVFSGPEGLGVYPPSPAGFAPTDFQILSKWSWSGTPSDAQIGTHFDDIAKFAGLCPATLQGVTMRSRYNINQDYSREISAGALPTAPTTIRDQIGSQNFTKVGSPGQGTKLHTSYRNTAQLPLAYSPKSLAELDAFIDGSSPFARYKASSNTVSGGKVTEFIDTLNSANKLTQSNAAFRVVTPAADAAFGGATSATFTGAEGYYSNQTPSTWNFLHNGAGMSIVSIYVATGYAAGGGDSLLITNFDGAGGFSQTARSSAAGGNTCGIGVLDDSNQNVTSCALPNTHPTANYSVGAWKYTGAISAPDTSLLYTRQQVLGVEGVGGAFAPSSTTPTQSLQLGYYYISGDVVGGGNQFVGRWVETIIWNRRLTRAELFDVKSWAQKKFSIPQ